MLVHVSLDKTEAHAVYPRRPWTGRMACMELKIFCMYGFHFSVNFKNVNAVNHFEKKKSVYVIQCELFYWFFILSIFKSN